MCTTMIITKGATLDGSMMVTHSDDNELSDQQIIRVPAQKHDANRISEKPIDNAYTLMHETTDLDNPVYMNFNFTIDSINYQHKIRLVITPHFSFNNNFMPQYRLSPTDYETISQTNDFASAITVGYGFKILPEVLKHPSYYHEIQLDADTCKQARAKLHTNYPELYATLEKDYYNPHKIMSDVLINMYDNGELSYNGDKNYLQRTDGACKFCVNQHWQFNGECYYENSLETSPPTGYLEKVADYIIKNGKPEK